MVKRSLPSSSIPELVMRRCVLMKTLQVSFPLGQVVYLLWCDSLTKKLANRTKKRCSALVLLDRLRVPRSSKRTQKWAPLNYTAATVGGIYLALKNPSGRRLLDSAQEKELHIWPTSLQRISHNTLKYRVKCTIAQEANHMRFIISGESLASFK